MTAGPRDAQPSADLPSIAAVLRPLVDRITAVRASVQTKLLVGFLCVASLLLVLAGLSLAVQRHMNDRVNEIDLAQERLDHLRQMQYLITSQSHDRTMALLTHDARYNELIAQAKADFSTHLDALEEITPPDVHGVLERIREVNERFNSSSERVLALYLAGQDGEALRLHLEQEHPLSHEIENPVGQLLNQAELQMSSSQGAYASDQSLLTGLLVGFSALSVVGAGIFGFVFSWSFLLQTLNQQLRGTNTELLVQLQAQVEELARSRGLITEAEERLRRELAEVLHSRVQTRLLVVWYRLEELLKDDVLRTDPAAANTVLAELHEQIDSIREQDVRQLSHRLHPSIIRTGLVPALETLVDDMAPLNIGLNVEAEVVALDRLSNSMIPEVVRLTAYRVVEEALANVVKHAAATCVEISVRLVKTGLQIDVHDNGRGLPGPVQPGLGLGSISAHVGRVAGEWSITSSPGSGTTLTAVLPCSVEQLQNGLSAQAALWHERSPDAVGSSTVVGIV